MFELREVIEFGRLFLGQTGRLFLVDQVRDDRLVGYAGQTAGEHEYHVGRRFQQCLGGQRPVAVEGLDGVAAARFFDDGNITQLVGNPIE